MRSINSARNTKPLSACPTCISIRKSLLYLPEIIDLRLSPFKFYYEFVVAYSTNVDPEGNSNSRALSFRSCRRQTTDGRTDGRRNELDSRLKATLAADRIITLAMRF